MGNVLGCCDPRNAAALRRDLLLEEEAEELRMEKTSSSSSPRDEGAEAKTAEPEPKRLKSQEGGAAAGLPQDASVEMQAQHNEEKSGATVAPEQVKLEPQGNPLAAPPTAGAQQGKRHIGLLRHSARVDNPDDAAKADLDDPRPRSPIAAPAPSLSSLPLCLPRSPAAMARRAR
eukprot:COSAG04_NODE_696_length_11062_cov_47.390769_3_plen_174_part_00